MCSSCEHREQKHQLLLLFSVLPLAVATSMGWIRHLCCASQTLPHALPPSCSFMHSSSVIRVEITSEEQSQPGSCSGDRANSTSSVGDKDGEDDTMPSLSSEQLARRPSFKSVVVYFMCMYMCIYVGVYMHYFDRMITILIINCHAGECPIRVHCTIHLNHLQVCTYTLYMYMWVWTGLILRPSPE